MRGLQVVRPRGRRTFELDRYSTFALPDYEKEEGQTLLCRAHAYEDLVIELLNYDEEIIRSGLPLRKGVVEVVSNEPVTHDMRHLVRQARRARGDQVLPGPVHGLHGPRHGREPVVLDGEHAQPGRQVRVRHQDLSGRPVLRVPGRRRCTSGDRLEVEAPFGTFTLRESRTSDLIFVGGGAGMAPVLGLLRSMADRGVERKATFYYGARAATRPVLRGGARSARREAPRLPLHPGALRARSTTTTGTARSG